MRSMTSLQRALDGLASRRLFLLLAPGAYREDERRDPDRNEEDVGHGGHAGREPDRAEERVSVDDQDEPAHGGAHDAGRQYADDVGRDGGGGRGGVGGAWGGVRREGRAGLGRAAVAGALVWGGRVVGGGSGGGGGS